jgi:hypothetical protein
VGTAATARLDSGELDILGACKGHPKQEVGALVEAIQPREKENTYFLRWVKIADLPSAVGMAATARLYSGKLETSGARRGHPKQEVGALVEAIRRREKEDTYFLRWVNIAYLSSAVGAAATTWLYSGKLNNAGACRGHPKQEVGALVKAIRRREKKDTYFLRWVNIADLPSAVGMAATAPLEGGEPDTLGARRGHPRQEVGSLDEAIRPRNEGDTYCVGWVNFS